MGFETRHLGEVQMTTDTAVNVTMMVVEQKGVWREVHLYTSQESYTISNFNTWRLVRPSWGKNSSSPSNLFMLY